jgi:hypothetical protein
MQSRALRRRDHVRRSTPHVNTGRPLCQRPAVNRDACGSGRPIARWVTSWDGRLVIAWSVERSPAVRTTTSEDVMSDSDDGRSPRTGTRARPPVLA